MPHWRTKGPSIGIRADCGRCGFRRIVVGTDSENVTLTPEEELGLSRGEAELFAANAPPGAGDLCPRCFGDAWSLRRPGG